MPGVTYDSRMVLTRFGFHFSSVSYEGVKESDLFGRIMETAQAAEASGFDSIWVPDHVHQNQIGGGPGGPMLEAYTLLGALATATQKVMLGSMVSPVTFRNPALLAKTVTTLDVVSSGRAILGIGAAWDSAEHHAYGLDFPPTPEREDRLEETAALCRQMLSAPTTSYDGRHYATEGAWNVPRPVQDRVPILIGGGGERRTLGAVARYADACNLFGDPSTLAHKLGVLSSHCERIGRDPSEISSSFSVFPPDDPKELVSVVSERFAVGMQGVVLFGGSCPSPDTVRIWGEALQEAFG